MNKIFALIIVLTLFVITSNSKAAPLVKIIVSPCDYHDKEIYTSGLLGIPNTLQPKEARLFLTQDDYKYNNLQQSIIVILSDEMALKYELYNNKFIGIQGLYDCSKSSHGSHHSGGFKSISRLTLAFKNPNVDTNLFSSGLVTEVLNKRIVSFGQQLLKKMKESSSTEELYDFLFKNHKNSSMKFERLNWIFENYLSQLKTEKYNLCKAFEYQEKDDLNNNMGFLCYSKGLCDFSGIVDAKKLPDWRDTQGQICLIYDDENGKSNLSLLQFY